MRVAPKKTISLTSSSVAASTESEYAAGTTYATDDVVKVSFESDGLTAQTPVVEYKSLADSNTGNYPPDSPTQWSEIGTSNRWAMFDDYINSVTTDTSNIVVAVGSARSDLVGLFGLVGSSVTLTLTRSGSTIKTEEISLKKLPAVSYYSWMFDEYEYTDRVFWEYPKYSDASLSVTIATTGGTASCGEMVLGSKIFLGQTQYDASVGIEDYSVYATDSLGRTYLNPGDYADRAEVELWLYNDTVDTVRRKLADVRGVMSLWDLNNIGSDYDSLRIYGFFESFDIIIPGPTFSKGSLSIRGTT
jgi:hypothetical protein